MKTNEHGADIYSESLKKGIEYDEIIDFSSNINPLGLNNQVISSIKKELENIDRYPDINCRELIKAISEKEDIDENMVFVSNGAAEAIYRIPFVLKPKNALLLAPTFSEYESSLYLVDAKIDYYYLDERNSYKIQEDYIDRIKNYDVIYICNPNNPTGQLTNKNFIKKILDEALENEVDVVIDECFIDFLIKPSEYSSREFLKLYTNLIIINAFTKTYSLPGIRLGYAMSSNTELIKNLKKFGPPWNVSNLAQIAGRESLKLENYLGESSLYIHRERKYLVNNLVEMDFKIFDGYANFILFKTRIKNFKEKLLKYKILIRDCSNYKNLSSQYYRIAVKSSEKNKYLIESIKKVIESEDK